MRINNVVLIFTPSRPLLLLGWYKKFFLKQRKQHREFFGSRPVIAGNTKKIKKITTLVERLDDIFLRKSPWRWWSERRIFGRNVICRQKKKNTYHSKINIFDSFFLWNLKNVSIACPNRQIRANPYKYRDVYKCSNTLYIITVSYFLYLKRGNWYLCYSPGPYHSDGNIYETLELMSPVDFIISNIFAPNENSKKSIWFCNFPQYDINDLFVLPKGSVGKKFYNKNQCSE